MEKNNESKTMKRALNEEELELVTGGNGQYDEDSEDLLENETDFYEKHKNDFSGDYEKALIQIFPGSL